MNKWEEFCAWRIFRNPSTFKKRVVLRSNARKEKFQKKYGNLAWMHWNHLRRDRVRDIRERMMVDEYKRNIGDDAWCVKCENGRARPKSKEERLNKVIYDLCQL